MQRLAGLLQLARMQGFGAFPLELGRLLVALHERALDVRLGGSSRERQQQGEWDSERKHGCHA
jgi:hypothetical protein